MGIKQSCTRTRSFLTSLLRDVRANTLAIMAMSLIPLAGMVGGGVDISRMYIVKTRLQHACDAGALAGRKAMGGGTWAQTVNGVANYPNSAAEKFFDANYNSSAYGATTVTRSFSESAGKVSGTASAVLPMTLMRIFGRTNETLQVACSAEMRLPNTDVMFVLDVTGSMADRAAQLHRYFADSLRLSSIVLADTMAWQARIWPARASVTSISLVGKRRYRVAGPTPARRAISRIGTFRPPVANSARAASRMSSRLSRASERRA